MNDAIRGKKSRETIHRIPRFIMNLHSQGVHNSTEFLLHELSLPHCYNLSKAIYLIDNPDFNCLKGIAGFAQSEQFFSDNHWQQPELFLKHMSSASLHQKVKTIERENKRLSESAEKTMLLQLAHDLGVEKPSFKKVPIKHDNIGIFIFEPCDYLEYEALDEDMEESLYLLGFTPIV